MQDGTTTTPTTDAVDTPVSTPETVTPLTTTDSTDATPEATTPLPEAASVTPVAAPVTVPQSGDETAGVSIAVAPVLAASLLRRTLFQYGVAAVIVALMGLVLWYLLEAQGRVETGVFDKAKALVLPAPAVATVNGERIPLANYEKNTASLVTSVEGQGLDPQDPSIAEEIKKQALDLLINTEVLRQAAVAAGVVVTDEQVEARYQEILASVGDAATLATKMAELGITEESLRTDIRGEILIQTHLDSAVDLSTVTVTPEEVTAMYAGLGGDAAVDVPSLDELRPQIEQQLRYGKEQDLIGAYIETLKAAADIEVLI